MAEDEKVKKLASMLQSGATMLDLYCPVCSNILFKLKNQQIFCPICEKEVKIIKDDKSEIINNKSKKESPIINTNNFDFETLNNIYSSLFSNLSKKIQNTSEIQVIENLINIQLKILEIIKKLRELTYE